MSEGGATDAEPGAGPTGTGRPARVLLASIRRLNPHVAWCSNYEFEDVLREVDDVDLLELEPGSLFELRERLARSVAWRRPRAGFLRPNPGVRTVKLRRDYDLFVFVCMNVWDLLYLNAIGDWRSRCRTKICYMVEFYGKAATEYDHLLRQLAEFDVVAHSFSESVAAIEKVVGRPCHHVPLAADVRRFTPYPAPPSRVIDVLSVGRRSEPMHQALLRLAAGQGLFYVYDTIPSRHLRPSSPAQHREMFASCAKRSRLFVTFPAKFGDAENQGQSDVGARYFEGSAAGTVMIGRAPTARAFRADFPWPDAVIEAGAGGSDTADLLADLEARPAEMGSMSVRNAVAALRRHDWAHRWQTILQIAGVAPRPALARRIADLQALAAAAERAE